MEGWLLDSIYADLGQEVGDRVKYLYDTCPTFDNVPFVVLVRILSFVDKGDIFNVMCVCKQWLKASKERGFWEQHQREMVVSMVKDMEYMHQLCLTRPVMQHVFYYFDFFAFKDYGPKEFFGHLFKNCKYDDSGNYVKWVNGEFYIRLEAMCSDLVKVRFAIQYTHDGQWVSWSTRQKHMKRFKNHGLRTFRFLGGKVEGTVYASNWVYRNGKFIRNFDNVIIMPNGDRFDGQCFEMTDNPHGAGKWTFADGTTLTGDSVAFDGKPHGKGHPDEAEFFAGEPVHKRMRYSSSS